MSDEKKYTEREMVLAQRQAFAAGVRDGRCNATALSWRAQGIECRARRFYPLPTITRNRIVADPHNHEPHWGKPREWTCFFGGSLASRTIGLDKNGQSFPWTYRAQVPPTPQRVALWADLLANPTETVEEEK